MARNEHLNKVAQRPAGPVAFALFSAFVGAAVYFVHQSSGFWGFIGAIFKAIVWPAFLVYHGLEALGA